MRILFKSEEEKLEKLFESKHNELVLFKDNCKKLEKSNEELTNQLKFAETNFQMIVEDLQVKLVSANGAKGGYIKKINELKANLEEANKKATADKEVNRHLEKELEEQRNYYSTKLEEANKKIDNYKKDALSGRIKPTIQEYDNRLKYRRNKNGK